jgi:transcription elongation factor GreB
VPRQDNILKFLIKFETSWPCHIGSRNKVNFKAEAHQFSLTPAEMTTRTRLIYNCRSPHSNATSFPQNFSWTRTLTEATTTAAVYLTPGGARRMRAELKDILYTLRPEMVKTAAWAASNGDRSENADYHYAKRRLRQLDSRIRFLSKRLEAATIVDPVEQQKIAGERVLFGATVRVENEEGEEKTFSIVGADELDLSRGHISWTSPLGRALLGAHPGDLVSFVAPGGKTELEVLKVEYLPLD